MRSIATFPAGFECQGLGAFGVGLDGVWMGLGRLMFSLFELLRGLDAAGFGCEADMVLLLGLASVGRA